MAVCLLGFSLSARSGLEDYPGNYPDSAGRLSLFSPTLHLPSQNLTQDSINIGYTYWFDEDYAHRQQGNLSIGHLLIDASTLADGIHALYMQLGYGTAAQLESFMFYSYHTPPELSQDSFNINYTYWIDEDYAHRQQGNLGNGHLLIDASTLTDGIHALYMQLGYGANARLEKFMFYSHHTPPELSQDSFSIDYTYWFDEDYAHRQQGSLSYGNLMIDASALTEGFHTVYMQLGHGTDARLEKYMFNIPPERFYEEYTDMVYWFGDDTTVHRFSPIAGTHLITVPEMACGEEGLIHMMAIDSIDNTSPVLNHTFIKTDSSCCLPPLFVTADNVTDSGARLHWDYDRPQTFTLVYDTVPINNPNVGHNRVTLTDTVYWFTNMPSGIICYYAIKSECSDHWAMGEWNTHCRTLTPLYAEACESYTWQGITYTSSTMVPEFVYTTTGGCDSATVMHINIHHSTSGIETINACDSYTWQGSTYTSSTNTPSYTSTNAQGCDSVTTLHLTINHSTSATETVTACDSYTWNGNTYSISSIDSITSTNAQGCDSVTTLYLTINYSTRDTIVDSATGSYTWNDNTYTESGEYLFEGLTEAGCDSVVVLQLTITQLGINIAEGNNNIFLYPNPTPGKLTIVADDIEKVEVFDQSGRIAATFKDTNEIDIHNLPTGAYTLRITLHNGSAVKRVIKQ